MQRNIRLEIEYDGTDFHGWQIQPKLRTVQGEIQERLKAILRHEVSLIGAGRTDVGVHALGQVANFKTENPLDGESIQRGLNGLLADDVVIKKVQEVDPDFHARYTATSRRYKYRVYPGRTAILRRYVWEVLYSLNLDKIGKAAEAIQGEHDFSSFCVAESAKENNICEVTHATWGQSGDELIFRIEANRFLHTMVRSLVGTLVEVGRGYFSVADFVDILKAKDRRKAGPTAPACGLYLVSVNY
ncbi:MAG: tRNA pseudouridine(38-40) synthase TruA [Candidatus Zixiibacteriota bacterium]|nr:MAG: tRNA pseudouridine(38-40) synthase TruA [candidate division Zixibacteria bacterium]